MVVFKNVISLMLCLFYEADCIFFMFLCANDSAGGGSRVSQTIIQPNPLRLSLWSSMKSQAVFSQSLLLFCFLRQTGATSSPAHLVIRVY